MRVTILILLTALVLGACGPVDSTQLEERKGIVYEKGTVRSFTGRAVSYYPDTGKERRVYQEGPYEMGFKDGVWTTYKWGGEREEAPYKLGKLHGTLVRYYESGARHVEENYRNGLLHGLSTEYDPQGEMIIQKNYKDGKQVYMPSSEESDKENRASEDFWGRIKKDFEQGYIK